jgi:DNA-binding MarR family transcriptional regulator
VDSPAAGVAVRDELIRLLQRHFVEATRMRRAFAEHHDLHPTDWAALLAVMQGERTGTPLTPGRLGERLLLSSGATTAVVDRLERAGHLRRERDGRDRRRVTLHRGERAHTLIAAFYEPFEASMEAVMVGFTALELAVVQRFLGDIVAQLVDDRQRLTDS